jgi:hypothetical protein
LATSSHGKRYLCPNFDRKYFGLHFDFFTTASGHPGRQRLPSKPKLESCISLSLWQMHSWEGVDEGTS